MSETLFEQESHQDKKYLDDARQVEDEKLLEKTWNPPGGFFGWFKIVNATYIGRRYVVTAFVFFLLAGVLGLLMRLQLAQPEMRLLNPDLYNQIFTMHGITMMFLFAVPVMEGLGAFLVPLMIGTRDMAFPRLNAFGYYVYLLGGITLYAALFLGIAPDAGWFNYPPLANLEYSPGMRVNIYAMLITFIEIAALVAAVELVVTIFKQRAPGMSLNRMPLYVWSLLVTGFMIIFAMPVVMVGSMFLAFDRSVGTHFFETLAPAGQGPLLWQHLFWFFGHPEVYIIFIPALGIISSIVTTFARRPVYGYTAIVLSIVATGFLGFALWVHHMYTTGLPQLGLSFFTAASAMIAIPSGVQIFCWIATLWGGRPVFKTPLLFILGFFFIFVLGGLTGVMIASVPFDAQVHDTYFIVAHFHYVLIGGAVFPLFGGIYYWFPKLFGTMLHETAGKGSFWLMFIGFNAAFFPMHNLGLMGMPRRVYTYIEGLGWSDLNLLATAGALTLAFGVLITVLNALWSVKFGRLAGENPWDADTLEWAAPSPPPGYNHSPMPAVRGLHPVWDMKKEGVRPIVTGVREDVRQVVTTTLMDAAPHALSNLATPSYAPLMLAGAVGIAFIGFLFSLWWLAAGFFLSFLIIVYWNYPREAERTPPWEVPFAEIRKKESGDEKAENADEIINDDQAENTDEESDGQAEGRTRKMSVEAKDIPMEIVCDVRHLSSFNFHDEAPLWWGFWGIILIETTVFASLIASYFYLNLSYPQIPPDGVKMPDLLLPSVSSLFLFSSSYTMHTADKASERGDNKTLKWFLIFSILLAAVFLALKYIEYSNVGYSWDSHAYGSVVWAIVAFHSTHVVSLVLKTIFVSYLAWRGYFNEERHLGVTVNGIYWHFVVAVWLPLYLVLYWSPRLF